MWQACPSTPYQHAKWGAEAKDGETGLWQSSGQVGGAPALSTEGWLYSWGAVSCSPSFVLQRSPGRLAGIIDGLAVERLVPRMLSAIES